MGRLTRFSSGLANCASLIANIMMLGMVLSIGIQVVARFLIGAPTTWSEELARFLLVGATMFGSAALMRKNEHITIDIFVEMLPPQLAAWVSWLRDAIMLTVCGLLAHYGWLLVGIGGRQTSTGLGIKMSTPYLAIPVGAALMALALVLSRMERLNGEGK